MFVSLNKKIIYTISFFFLLVSILFIYTFYLVYGAKIQEEQRSNIAKNQQYIELLMQNINMLKDLREINIENKNIKFSPVVENLIFEKNSSEKQMNELSKQNKYLEEMNKSYDERYQVIHEGIKIIALSAILLALSVIFLGFLLRKWVLEPIENISLVNDKVSNGLLSMRVKLDKKHYFNDEFDNLASTYNQMLDTIETNIREIKTKEKFLQDLIDGIPDGIRVIDDDFNIIIANKAYYKQTGEQQSSCAKKCFTSCQNLDNPCSESMFTCPLKEIISSQKNKVQVIQQFQAFPNRHLAINAAPLYLSSEKKYIVEAIRDLSDDINFSHQQKVSSLSFLASSVAHEMKNNLGSIRMIMERLLDKYHKDDADDEETRHLRLIYNQILACIGVPERLLKLSQANPAENIKLDCQQNIKEVIALLDFEAKKNGIDIEFKAPQKAIFILGDEGDFKMVVMNLILNAIKAMMPGKKIYISVAQKKAEQLVVIRFKDEGIGIEPQNLKRIFEPFYSNGKNLQKQGTGLGLAIVKSIVEKFEGTISVESKVNKGSCFTLMFPLAK